MPDSGRKNFLAGLVTLAFGAFAVWQSYGHSIGTPQRMGPGFFPMALGIILLIVGAAIVVQALRTDEAMPRVRLRPYLVIPASLALFAVFIDRVGFVVSALTVVVAAAYAEPAPSRLALALLSVVLLGATYVVFVAILGVPISLFAWRW